MPDQKTQRCVLEDDTCLVVNLITDGSEINISGNHLHFILLKVWRANIHFRWS